MCLDFQNNEINLSALLQLNIFLSSSAEYLPARMKGVLSNFKETVVRNRDPLLSSVPYGMRIRSRKTCQDTQYGGSIDEKDADILLGVVCVN